MHARVIYATRAWDVHQTPTVYLDRKQGGANMDIVASLFVGIFHAFRIKNVVQQGDSCEQHKQNTLQDFVNATQGSSVFSYMCVIFSVCLCFSFSWFIQFPVFLLMGSFTLLLLYVFSSPLLFLGSNTSYISVSIRSRSGTQTNHLCVRNALLEQMVTISDIFFAHLHVIINILSSQLYFAPWFISVTAMLPGPVVAEEA